MNISGISGLATKTSYVMFLLTATLQRYADADKTAVILLNVKHDDLLHIHEPNDRLTEADRDMWEALGLACTQPVGACYAFPSVARFGLSAHDFAMRLLWEDKVATVPGTAFGDCGKGHLRCAYATRMDNPKEAMARMRHFVERP